MKNILVLIFTLFIIFSLNAQDAIKNVIVETYYISDANDATDTTGGILEKGSITYRVYIQMKPGYMLKAVYGESGHPLKIKSTEVFYNNSDRGKSFGKDIDPRFINNNTVALDTWLTLGQTTKTGNITSPKMTNVTFFGVLKSEDTDGSILKNKNGLLVNKDPLAGIPLTSADGMDTLMNAPIAWFDYGFKNLLSGVDSTIFGSAKADSVFISENAFLKNSGVMGVIPETNEVLVAQLTTKGKISFELNVKIADKDNVEWNYVASGADSTGVSVSPYLKYPQPAPTCGCTDSTYLEFNNKYLCGNIDSCKRKIVFGCMDPNACNYGPNVNFNLPSLCCYPGSCADRDIALVCPDLGKKGPVVNIYPNPANDKLEISISDLNSEKLLLSIYDLYGNVFFENYLNNTAGIHSINLSSFTKGLYLVRIQNNNGINITKYLIKN
jgi:hypothetical protein